MEIKIYTDKQKIIQYLVFKGVSKNKFYKETGFANGFLDSGSSFSLDNLRIILDKYRDINPDWLLSGKGEMIIHSDYSVRNNTDKKIGVAEEGSKYTIFDKSPAVDVQEIPLYDLEATAGILSLFNDTHSNPVDTIRIPGVPKCDGAIPITGDSMYPLLKSGDIVLYKQVNDPLTCTYFWGEMYIVGLLQDGETFVMVKYIQRSELGAEYIKLVSQNQHHNPIDVLKININALALVRASVRINAMQ